MKNRVFYEVSKQIQKDEEQAARELETQQDKAFATFLEFQVKPHLKMCAEAKEMPHRLEIPALLLEYDPEDECTSIPSLGDTIIPRLYMQLNAFTTEEYGLTVSVTPEAAPPQFWITFSLSNPSTV